jgi:hypothetical protein
VRSVNKEEVSHRDPGKKCQAAANIKFILLHCPRRSFTLNIASLLLYSLHFAFLLTQVKFKCNFCLVNISSLHYLPWLMCSK